MKRRSIVMLVAVAGLGGCQKDLLANLPDAAIDATPDAIGLTACPQPTLPLAPGTHKVFVNTEGQVLTSDGTCDDAPTNCTNLIKVSPTTIPRFLDGDPTRQAFIDQIVTMVEQVLAPYSIDIVTTRPTTGTYEMVVLGGDASITGGGLGIGGVTPFDCTTEPVSIGLVFEDGNPAALYASQILSSVGDMYGLGATAQDCDCQCIVDPVCDFSTCPSELCSFGSNVPTTSFAGFNCGITPTEDEPVRLEAAIGCR